MDAIALIGFGEAGQTFVRGGLVAAVGFDILGERRADLARQGIEAAQSGAAAASRAQTVLSLVTADQAETAARAAAGGLSENGLFFDMNSVAPGTKQAAARAVMAVGAAYFDVAIMAPVQPLALGVPLLVSGPGSEDGAVRLRKAGFTDVRAVGEDVGRASAIKMIRSVMIKGIEALTAEMMLAGRAAGVADEVLASLGEDWTARARYNLERMATHGTRRAAEMEEAVATLLALGVDPVMTRGTVLRQREAASPRSLAA